MIKKLIRLSFVFLVLALCCSCKKNDIEVNPETSLQMEINDHSDDQSDSDKHENDHKQQSDITTETINKSSPNIIDPMAPFDNSKEDIIISKEAWPYGIKFDGVISKNTQETGNLNTNYKYNLEASFLICPDKENDIIYYVNYGKDNYIYQLKNGVSTLLVEKESNFLQLRNNTLYFLSKNITKYHSFLGDIYSFNIDTSELSLIKQDNVRSLYIDSNKIFYSIINEIDTQTPYSIGYTLDFETKNSNEEEYIYHVRYNEYMLINVLEKGLYLNNSLTNDLYYLAPIEYVNQNINICDDYLIFTKSSCIYTINLQNGERRIYDINKSTSLNDKVIIMDYIVINNMIYATDFNRIYKINITNGDLDIYKQKMTLFTKIEDNYAIRNLYTDNEKIYALIYQRNSKRLVELIVDGDLINTKELQ